MLDPKQRQALYVVEYLLAKKSLHEFVRQAWHVVEPEIPFADNWHIKAICDHLEAVADGKIPQLVINVPPGTSKSLITCVFFPAWVWATKPAKRFMTASYSETLSMRDAIRTRDLVMSDWYQKRWPLLLKADQNAKTRYDNALGGWRIVGSVTGRGIGEHPDFFIADDPHNVLQAESDKERETTTRWFEGVFCVRGEVRDAKRILIMQRLHALDCTGVALDKGGWEHLCLPMRYEAPALNEQNELVPRMKPTKIGFQDPRKTEGELLWPVLYTDDKVTKLENNMGLYNAAGQLQQRPSPRGGGKFQRNWFRILPVAPVLTRMVRYWDKAGCFIKGTIVTTANGGVPIEEVRVGDMVETSKGRRRVVWSGESKRVNGLCTVLFSNGRCLTGTPDHRVWTSNRHWVELASLSGTDRVVAWEEESIRTLRPSSSTEFVTSESLARDISRLGAGTRPQDVTGRTPCIGPSGSSATETFPLACTFTTRTKTQPTTTWKILNASAEASTCSGTGKNSEHPGIESCCRGFASWLRKVTNAIRRSRATKRSAECEELSQDSELLRKYSPALLAAVSSAERLISESSSSVPRDVTESTDGVPVYDIEVEDEHEFFANGILVHNSTDASSAETAGVLLGEYRDEGAGREELRTKWCILDIIHGRWQAAEREAIIKQTAMADQSRWGFVDVWVEQEPGSGGKESAQATVGNLAGFACYFERVTGAKEVRADPLASQASVGKVTLLSARWNSQFLDEMEAFPNGKLKDFVDGASGAFNKLCTPSTGVASAAALRFSRRPDAFGEFAG